MDFSSMVIMVLLKKNRVTYVPLLDFGGPFFWMERLISELRFINQFRIFAKVDEFTKTSRHYNFWLILWILIIYIQAKPLLKVNMEDILL